MPSAAPPHLLTYGDVANLLEISPKKLHWWVVALKERRRYRTFEIAKRNGGHRVISAPIKPIKDIQRTLLRHLETWYSPPAQAHGYVPGRDPRTNAAMHRRQEWVLRVDLQDFFPSIHFGRVRGLFLHPPFSFGPDAATLIAQICCFEGRLPQGAPTSPVISNMICRALDRDVAQLAARERCYFTRYADDLTFSTDRTRFPSGLAYIEGDEALVGGALTGLVLGAGFQINQDKTRLVHRSQRQRVTGIVVNRQINVPRDYIRGLGALLHVWERHGPKDAEASLARVGVHLNRPPAVGPVLFEAAVRGKVQYVGSVKGWDDPVYLALADRLGRLDPGFQPTLQGRERPPPNAGVTPTTRDLYVLTEGETDVILLRAAMDHFHASGEYQDLSLRFDSDSDFGSDGALEKHYRALTGTLLARRTVCLFDRDNEKTLRRLGLLQQDFVASDKNLACAALVEPVFRVQPFCIEMLFRDSDLRTTDAKGRRIYLRSEFSEQSGQHASESCAVREIKSNQLVRDDVFEFQTQKSLALSKRAFAELVSKRDAPFEFDFEGFRPTIEMLRQVARSLDAGRQGA